MIVKPIQVPLIIKKLEALLRRLPPNHPKRPLIEKELASRFKGYRANSPSTFICKNFHRKTILSSMTFAFLLSTVNFKWIYSFLHPITFSI
ncbi:hypothetical protein SAMN05428981_101375 [Bacillus sp. OV194]|nr:hypothetical protein SAMN05428981_101375 [Bacillus sp. OV194]